MQTRRRTILGPERSAALPQIWSALYERGWSDAHLAREMGGDTASVSRLLYGDRKANRQQAARLLALLGTPLELWDEPCEVRRRKHAPSCVSSIVVDEVRHARTG